jgi:hypothetical protein
MQAFENKSLPPLFLPQIQKSCVIWFGTRWSATWGSHAVFRTWRLFGKERGNGTPTDPLVGYACDSGFLSSLLAGNILGGLGLMLGFGKEDYLRIPGLPSLESFWISLRLNNRQFSCTINPISDSSFSESNTTCIGRDIYFINFDNNLVRKSRALWALLLIG